MLGMIPALSCKLALTPLLIPSEAAASTLGYSYPEGVYSPLGDPDIHVNARGVAFGTWLSSYFAHPDLDSRMLSGLEQRIPQRPRREPTNETLHPDEFLAIIDPGPATRWEGEAQQNWKVAHEQTRIALLDEEMVSEWLPRIKVTSVNCAETVWGIIWGMWKLEEELKAASEEGVRTRDVNIVFLDEGNHFVSLLPFPAVRSELCVTDL